MSQPHARVGNATQAPLAIAWLGHILGERLFNAVDGQVPLERRDVHLLYAVQ